MTFLHAINPFHGLSEDVKTTLHLTDRGLIMQLYVAHKDEAASHNRFFAVERPSLENLKLFDNFYFRLNETEVKYYDVEQKETHIECHIDILHNNEWKTITRKDSKQKYSYNSLNKLSEEAHIIQYNNKGISYSLISYHESNNRFMIQNYLKKNKRNMNKPELELATSL